MDERELFETQYGQGKLVYRRIQRFQKMREVFGKYDYDRYKRVEQLIVPGVRILDIGCGNGDFLRRVSCHYKELYGMDILASAVNKAEQKTKEMDPSEAQKFKWIEGKAGETLPFPDRFLDTIVCISTLDLIYDLFGVIREMNRVLKEKGWLVVEVSNIAYLPRRLALVFGKLPAVSAASNWEEIGWDGGVIHYFTMHKLCWLFESNGFRITKKGGSGFLANLRSFWPSFLCGDLIIRARKV